MIISTPPNQSMRTSPSFPFVDPPDPLLHARSSAKPISPKNQSLESSEDSEANGDNGPETSSDLGTSAGECDGGGGSDGTIRCRGGACLGGRFGDAGS